MSEEFDYNRALKKAKLKKLDQDLKLSQEYFGTAKCITISWIVILCIVLLYQFFVPFYGYGKSLSDGNFKVLFSATTATIISIWVVAGASLFKK